MRYRCLPPRVAVIEKPNPQAWHGHTQQAHTWPAGCEATTLCKGLAFSSKINTSLVTQPSLSCLLPLRSGDTHTSKGMGKGGPVRPRGAFPSCRLQVRGCCAGRHSAQGRHRVLSPRSLWTAPWDPPSSGKSPFP